MKEKILRWLLRPMGLLSCLMTLSLNFVNNWTLILYLQKWLEKKLKIYIGDIYRIHWEKKIVQVCTQWTGMNQTMRNLHHILFTSLSLTKSWLYWKCHHVYKLNNMTLTAGYVKCNLTNANNRTGVVAFN